MTEELFTVKAVKAQAKSIKNKDGMEDLFHKFMDQFVDAVYEELPEKFTNGDPEDDDRIEEMWDFVSNVAGDIIKEYLK